VCSNIGNLDKRREGRDGRWGEISCEMSPGLIEKHGEGSVGSLSE
jgi:hypothetical protein